MQLKTFISLAAVFTSLVGGAAAQASFVRLPTANSTLTQGHHFVVQLVRPNSIQGSIEVGLAIGVLTCTPGFPCPDPTSQMGTVLYNGQYNPKLHELPGEPYENFTLTIPTGLPTGQSQIGVVRLHLIGAGPSAVLEQHAVPVTVV
ncbi:hypothetical protein GYMLUDRAFT_75057 [Collybiopsis luxurians FD-317 M1]|uniref:Phosphatidylglycerol/phosphatidylinositol transfer protein n=1 Tax=Collybiopsis luxurians FD-317 M1 TaxID=944289 RepID=A0A0D0B4Q3_9AGAR|nr:hypothetical protein GYMLUDRAFT_75057 [Collybiopsis luxurians FD-317 M1]